ncbi:MAG TPA: DUF3332 family protein [Polyangia bacterium]|nr:DUF3332 family protein [Polyangia bacterium]
MPMTKRTKRILRHSILFGSLMVLLSQTTGCFGTGRFRAINTIYDFNKSASDNGVVRSLLMVGMIIIPVYEIAGLVDILVLNTIDFFNGGKVASTETLPDGSKVMMAKIDADTVRVRHVDVNGKETSFDVVRVGDKAGFVRDADGHVLGNVERLSDGRLVTGAP